MLSIFWLRVGKYPFDRTRDQIGQFQFGFDRDFARSDFCIAAVAGQCTGLLHQRITALSRRIIPEDIKRILTGMKAALACIHLAIMRVGLADLELIISTTPVQVEPLDGLHDFAGSVGLWLLAHGFPLRGRCGRARHQAAPCVRRRHTKTPSAIN